jgi:LmbE family N-acetylglucosaminyl deacetylase
MFNQTIRNTYRRHLMAGASNLDKEALSSSAIIFAPHPDDETLGCGGTIIKKLENGAVLKIVFLADGSSSHQHLIPTRELIEIRESEALSAAQKLGVETSAVHFLRFSDGTLSDVKEAAIPLVVELLEDAPPRQVFIPYHSDYNPDHIATNRIVLAALIQLGLQVDVFEYPVWWWYHWPWVRLTQRDPKQALQVVRNTYQVASKWNSNRDFTYIQQIDSVLDRKRLALEAHRSQMTQLIPDNGWPTLPVFSRGEFLSCFFQSYEIFYSYKMTLNNEERNV